MHRHRNSKLLIVRGLYSAAFGLRSSRGGKRFSSADTVAEAAILQFGIGRHCSARPALAASRWLCPGRAESVRIVPETESDEGQIITFVIASVRLVRPGECLQMTHSGHSASSLSAVGQAL